MPRRKSLSAIHLASTTWFMLCVGYVFVLALRQLEFRWWVIFSLSGHSVLILLLLISLYLFAVFRGVSRTQEIEIEHPLTRTSYYMAFYTATPFLGGLAACVGMIGTNTISQFFAGIGLGTLGMTFLVWVIVDPAIGLFEMLLPASRRNRLERLAQAEAERARRKRNHEKLLAEVFAREESDRRHWQEVLEPWAERLAKLLASDISQAEREAVDFGASAWQLGGLPCMRQLRDMALAVSKQKAQCKMVPDYISVWWDGIGNWRTPPPG
ncbi:MAG: hypothetical protein JSU70_10950 [Phycisphaerales bacterium]|nr:MAG: hypothetical protein JSU70_10950 [Phycisphaerales bacterium]